MTPLEKFKTWYEKERQQSSLALPAACCMSTCGLDGYPNARFVSLKEVYKETFIITGPLQSRKGQEIAACPKVALTFWWTETERQVRIQGDAKLIPGMETDRYFQDRNTASKIVSTISQQGQPIEDFAILKQKLENQKALLIEGANIPRPLQWGGFAITPHRIEFMQFVKSRLHERVLFEKNKQGWQQQCLQP